MPEDVVTGDPSRGSFEAHFEAKAAAESVTPDASTTPKPTAPAPGQPPVVERAQGPIPFVRHKAILDKARADAQAEREAAVASYREKVGWAEGLTREEVERAQYVYQQLRVDPAAAAVELWQGLQNTPAYAERMRSEAARILQSARQTPQAQEPGPDLQSVDEQGRVTLLYSADQLAKRDAFREAKLLEQFDAKLKPFTEDREARTKAAEAEALDKWSGDTAKQWLDHAKTNYPHWDKLEPSVRSLMAAYPTATLEQAYIEAFKRAGPDLQREAQTAVVTDLQTRAMASISNPASAAPTTPKRFGSFEELAEARRRGAG